MNSNYTIPYKREMKIIEYNISDIIEYVHSILKQNIHNRLYEKYDLIFVNVHDDSTYIITLRIDDHVDILYITKLEIITYFRFKKIKKLLK